MCLGNLQEYLTKFSIKGKSEKMGEGSSFILCYLSQDIPAALGVSLDTPWIITATSQC